MIYFIFQEVESMVGSLENAHLKDISLLPILFLKLFSVFELVEKNTEKRVKSCNQYFPLF